ncbi:hypothetical protein HMPREF3205_01726, partial [Streptococcus pasteurianus]
LLRKLYFPIIKASPNLYNQPIHGSKDLGKLSRWEMESSAA